jgi:two-component system response regulator HydG
MSAAGVVCPYELLGASRAVTDAVAQLARAASDDRGVLITAEPGLDAEAVARALHHRSARRSQPFVVLACDGASASSLEKQLIGGTQPARAADAESISQSSALARAAGGTLFLAGVTEMSAPLQRRLARLLRDGEVRVARRAAPMRLDVRVIAAVEDRLDAGLREELLKRLPLTVEVPALRQRREDVQVIAEAMLAARDDRRGFTPAARTVLAALPWRRNTAELGGLIERLTAAVSPSPIRQEDVLAEVQLDRAPARPTGSLRDARRQFEREFIASVLRDHSWQMREAARALGIERANLYRKARQLGIPLRREGTAEGRMAG